jgi:ABC-2 type transport system permease protein
MTGFAGTGSLLRLALRRDRILLVVWIFVFVVSAVGSAQATLDLYTSTQDLVAAAHGVNSTPALVALYGPVYDETSLGAVSLFKLGAFGGALVGVLSILLMIRHTRAEEEAGRLELVGSAVIGRHAPLAAAFIFTNAVNLALGLVTAVALAGIGLPTAGSFAFGLAWTSAGIAFSAVGGLAAQLTGSARAATGLAMAVLGATYVVRAIGDTAPSAAWLRWLSPIGWSQQVRSYQGNQWWVLAIPLAFFAAVAVAAHAVLARRDHGAGLFRQRPGPAEASPLLGGPLGLAWRLQSGLFYGWAIGFVVLGLVFGNIATNIGDLLTGQTAQEFIQKLGGVEALTDAFMSTELGFLGVFTSVYGVQAVLRLRAEESELRAEPILSTKVSRAAWAGSHITVALAGTAMLCLLAGLAAGLSYSAQTGHPDDFWRVLAAALVRIPASWVLVGIGTAAFGLLPRAVAIGWAALVAFLLLGELGPLFELPQWVMNLSPYAHVPRLPGGEFSAVPVVSLTLLGAALLVVGLVGFRRRDVPVI